MRQRVSLLDEYAQWHLWFLHRYVLAECAQDYIAHPEDYHLFTEEEYIELCLDFMKYLREDIVIERFVSQSPPEMLLAPRWGWKNYQFTQRIRKALEERLNQA